MVRTREHAEAICLCNAQEFEEDQSKIKFKNLLHYHYIHAWWSAMLQLTNKSVKYFGMILPSLLLANKYFNGEITLGTISQAGVAFRNLLESMSIVANSMHRIALIKASGQRVLETLQGIENCQQKSTLKYPVRLETPKR